MYYVDIICIATMSVDNAYGVFALINTIIYLVWAIILSVRRSALNYEDGGQSDAYVPQSAESIDPSYEKSGQYRQPLADDEVRDI